MTTHLLWRDVCAMSKALRKEIIAHGPDSITRDDAEDLVRRLSPHCAAEDASPPRVAHSAEPCSRPRKTLELRKASAPPLPGGLRLGKEVMVQNKLRWGKPREIWINEPGLLEQMMVFGSIGAGKTETLLSMAFNAASDGKAVFYMDAKGDTSLYGKVVSALSERGLVGNLRVINLMTGLSGATLTSKQTHTIDLFDGFDDGNLAQWLLAMLPTKQDRRKHQDQQCIAKRMFPVLARILVAWAQENRRRITPFDVGLVLQKDGLSTYAASVSGVHGHNARALHDKIWGPQAEAGWASVAAEMFLHLRRLWESYSHVFGGDQTSTLQAYAPEVGLSHLFDPEVGRLFVVVLAPAMMMSAEDLSVLTRAITSSLEQTLFNRSATAGCDTLVILDEFTMLEGPEGIARLSQIRNKGCGFVWGDYGTPSSEMVARWRAAGWKPPHTHVVMKNEADATTNHADYHQGSHGYLRWHLETQAELAWPVTAKLSDFGPGEGLVWDGKQCVDILMDYQISRHQQKTMFLVQSRSLAPAIYTQSSGYVGLSVVDLDRQAHILMERHQAWILSHSNPPALSWCQETVARMLGFADWHEARRAVGVSAPPE